MSVAAVFDSTSTDRELIRQLRRGASRDQDVEMMPESVAWHVYLELRRRGTGNAGQLFLDTLKHLHTRRSIGSVDLACLDGMPDEHRLVEEEDPFLADLWKAYKKCIRHNRTGPAAQLLRDIEEQLVK
ncbi:MAG: hypothetical protein AB8H79_13310 [Myxococcota bacterium]